MLQFRFIYIYILQDLKTEIENPDTNIFKSFPGNPTVIFHFQTRKTKPLHVWSKTVSFTINLTFSLLWNCYTHLHKIS